MLKKVLLAITFTFLSIIVAAGFIFIKLFLIGDIAPAVVSQSATVDVTNSHVNIHEFLPSSGRAYRNFSYRIDHSNMYIKIRWVLVGVYYSGMANISIQNDFSNINAIYIEDAKHNAELIWQR